MIKDTDVTGIMGHRDSKRIDDTDSYIEQAGIFPLGCSIEPADVPYPMFAHD